MTVQNRTIDYADNGTALEGYFAWDDAVSGHRPGVLIVHAWAGRSPFEEDAARKIASLGYAALAMDVYGKGILGSDPDEIPRAESLKNCIERTLPYCAESLVRTSYPRSAANCFRYLYKPTYKVWNN